MESSYWSYINYLIAIVGVGVYYGTNYSHTDSSVNSYVNNNVNISETENGLLIDGPGNETAMVFYPGAQIEYTAYLPMLSMLSQEGIDVFLVEMPLNLAILDTNAAEPIMNNYKYNHWIIGGHSLGGSMAASYYENHPNKIDGLVLLASYPSDNLTGKNLTILSIYGTNDGVLNKQTYNEKLTQMPLNFTEVVIKGGNHGGFCLCEDLEKDGQATISKEQQWNETVTAILNLFKN